MPPARGRRRSCTSSSTGPSAKALRLVKGSHIVVPKLFEHEHAYIFQNADGRIIFAIPYESDFTLIGTTDVECRDGPGDARADAQEIAYLCEQASRYFAAPVTPDAVRWTYSGVRPLLDDDSGDPSAVTRDYLLEMHDGGAPLLSVWGGKITTFRKLAEEAAQMLCDRLAVKRYRGPRRPRCRAATCRAGSRPRGAPTKTSRASKTRSPRAIPSCRARCAGAGRAATARWSSCCWRAGALGDEVAPGLHEAELRYLCEHEWARSADDVLWRRSKLGLHLSDSECAAVERWFAQRAGQRCAPLFV